MGRSDYPGSRLVNSPPRTRAGMATGMLKGGTVTAGTLGAMSSDGASLAGTVVTGIETGGVAVDVAGRGGDGKRGWSCTLDVDSPRWRGAARHGESVLSPTPRRPRSGLKNSSRFHAPWA